MLRDFVILIGVPGIVVVVLFALREYLRQPFASNRKVQAVEEGLNQRINSVTERIDAGDEALLEKFIDHKRHLNDRINRVESLTLGNQDAIAHNRNEVEKLGLRVTEINTHGSQPMRELMRMMSEMDKRIYRVSMHLGVEDDSTDD